MLPDCGAQTISYSIIPDRSEQICSAVPLGVEGYEAGSFVKMKRSGSAFSHLADMKRISPVEYVKDFYFYF